MTLSSETLYQSPVRVGPVKGIGVLRMNYLKLYRVLYSSGCNKEIVFGHLFVIFSNGCKGKIILKLY